MSDKVLLHIAEEHGQSRALEAKEVLAYGLISGLKATAVGVGAIAVVVGGRLVIGENVTLASIALTGAGVFAVSLAAHILGDLDTLVDSLRSHRSIYMPPQPEPQPTASAPGPPILVRPYKGEPYMLGQPEMPDRQEALQITPPLVAEILKATIEEYGGEWSRRKLMALRISGQRVSRGTYETLTSWLTRAGVLQQTRQGGFTLPPDVTDFEDLRAYFPNLPGLGGPGGSREGWERPVSQDTQPGDREVGTLAERRRQKWVEVGHDVVAYLEWRDNHAG